MFSGNVIPVGDGTKPWLWSIEYSLAYGMTSGDAADPRTSIVKSIPAH